MNLRRRQLLLLFAWCPLCAQTVFASSRAPDGDEVWRTVDLHSSRLIDETDALLGFLEGSAYYNAVSDPFRKMFSSIQNLALKLEQISVVNACTWELDFAKTLPHSLNDCAASSAAARRWLVKVQVLAKAVHEAAEKHFSCAARSHTQSCPFVG